jgi:pyruvate/2-oxoacid:ferredoxin oxidoreductase beta subunit/Pyruvate/2-oxoacid:ferredoxin oxidoreductase gamma subunit
MGLAGEEIAIVSDIGCSGLFDTFFNTHALHGLHGRALIYATGIKMARPNLKVIVTMGDGGLGIGGAHVLAACRRNIDLTLLVLNNFNYGMTGGQCSSTTPQNAQVDSGFLNRIEKPIDFCEVAGAAGAGLVMRASAYEKELVKKLETAIRFEGFSVVDVWEVCPGRYTKRNKITPESIEINLAQLPPLDSYIARNARAEYGLAYRLEAAKCEPAPNPIHIEAKHRAPKGGRQEVMILGGAGQRIVTAGEILCLAGATAGLHASQKNDYPVTVMRGHSVAEVILDESEINYTGIDRPSVVIALAQEGINRRRELFAKLPGDVLVLKARGLEHPPCRARITEVDFKAKGIKTQDRALASLAWICAQDRVLTKEMLTSALGLRFKGNTLEKATELVNAVGTWAKADG